MGRIVFGMLTSLDGYISGPAGRPPPPPAAPDPDEPLHRYFNAQMRQTAAALYGRRMYEVMRFWDTAGLGEDASDVEREFAEAWRAIPKIVFSSTLDAVGPGARLATAGLEAEVRAAKAAHHGEIEVAGAELAAGLAALDLIDEYRLYVQPVVFGGGQPFFAGGVPMRLRLVGTEALPEEVTLMRYAPARA